MNYRAQLEDANASYGRGELPSAESAYLALVECGQFVEWARFALGRIARDRGEFGLAVEYFTASIKGDPAFFWPHYERLQTAMQLGTDKKAMVTYGSELGMARWEPLADAHAEHLEKFAGILLEAKAAPEATLILENVWRLHGLSDGGAEVLLGLTRDETIIKELGQHAVDFGGDNPKLLRRLAGAAQQNGDLGREIKFLETLRAWNKNDFNTYLNLAKALARSGNEAGVNQLLEDRAGFGPAQVSFVELIASIELGQPNRSYASLLRHVRLYSDVPLFPAIRLAYSLSDLFDARRRNQIIKLLNLRHPGKFEVRLLEVNAAIRDQRWNDARSIFDSDLRHLDPKPKNVKLVEIELLAHSGLLPEAIAQVQEELKNAQSRHMFLLPAMRMFGEMQQWREVFQLGVPEVAGQNSYEGFFSPLLRSARKLGQIGYLFDEMLRLNATQNPAQKAALEALVEELAELGDSRFVKALDSGAVNVHRLSRIRTKARVSHSKLSERFNEICVYYCADRNYLLPAVISLVSLAVNNPDLARQVTFALVVEDADVPMARSFGKVLASSLGINLVIESADKVVNGTEKLRTGYGIFTGGQSLSLAAYYRIFYAKHLAQQGKFTKALYIDSDTLVRPGLSALFRADGTWALRARNEVIRPEVAHAKRILGIKGTYFNSGVLCFDLTHPDIVSCLDRAIAAALDEDVKLVFQDQCALNLGFDGRVQTLSENFNFFVTPKMPADSEIPAKAIILHYLDRPKPWDSLYRQEASEWFRWYEFTSLLMDKVFSGKLVWRPSSGHLEAES